jgi:antitoxin FitA
MATLTIRNLDEQVKRNLRIRAAENGRSMEEEARDVLEKNLVKPHAGKRGLGTLVHERFKAIGGVELELSPRDAGRLQPDFTGPDYSK